MRLIGQNDISKLYQEKIENIIRDYAESYGIKLPSDNKPANFNPNNLNININLTPINNPGKQQILNNITSNTIDDARILIHSNGNDANGNPNLDLQGI